mgnify:FL=1
MSHQALQDRPDMVSYAVWLLYGLIGTGIVRTSITVIRHADVGSPYTLIATKLAIYIVTVFLIYQISRGKNRARWVLLAFGAIALPLSIIPTFDSFTHIPFHSIPGLIQLGLYIVAMVLLFQQNSSAWFSPANHRTRNREPPALLPENTNRRIQQTGT